MSLETEVLMKDIAVNQKFPLLKLFRCIELQHTVMILTLLILTCNMYYIRSSEEKGQMSKYDFFFLRVSIIPLPSIDTMVIVLDRYLPLVSCK
jgi:hypothetical protein